MRIVILLAAALLIAGCQGSPCSYDEPSKNYISQSEEECRTIRFMCVPGTKPFFSECGCGCEAALNNTPGNDTLEEEHLCTDEERKAEVCAEVYQPVCGYFDPSKVQCIKYPCAQEFSNGCFACSDDKIKYWARGECPE